MEILGNRLNSIDVNLRWQWCWIQSKLWWGNFYGDYNEDVNEDNDDDNDDEDGDKDGDNDKKILW